MISDFKRTQARALMFISYCDVNDEFDEMMWDHAAKSYENLVLTSTEKREFRMTMLMGGPL